MPKRKARAGDRRLLHPDRLLRLWRRSRWWERTVALVFVLLAGAGVALLLVPVSPRVPHPEPPPFTVTLECPPAAVSAFAGRGGISSPYPDDPGFVATHDAVCEAQGRQRAVTGALLVAAGILNAAALLEIARLRRRRRRRQRREARRRSPSSSS